MKGRGRGGGREGALRTQPKDPPEDNDAAQEQSVHSMTTRDREVQEGDTKRDADGGEELRTRGSL